MNSTVYSIHWIYLELPVWNVILTQYQTIFSWSLRELHGTQLNFTLYKTQKGQNNFNFFTSLKKFVRISYARAGEKNPGSATLAA